MTGYELPWEEAFWAGYERGYERGALAGHEAGYRDGLAVLDEAAGLLARRQPWRTVEMLAARRRAAEATGTGLTPRQIRIQAAKSWGLPVPADLADPVDSGDVTDPATSGSATSGPTCRSRGTPGTLPEPEPELEALSEAGSRPVARQSVAELADEDDWACQL